MDIQALIEKKKAERINKGFAFRITFDKRAPFNGFYADKKTFDEQHSLAVASIGKRGRDGMTALSVEVL